MDRPIDALFEKYFFQFSSFMNSLIKNYSFFTITVACNEVPGIPSSKINIKIFAIHDFRKIFSYMIFYMTSSRKNLLTSSFLTVESFLFKHLIRKRAFSQMSHKQDRCGIFFIENVSMSFQNFLKLSK